MLGQISVRAYPPNSVKEEGKDMYSMGVFFSKTEQNALTSIVSTPSGIMIFFVF